MNVRKLVVLLLVIFALSLTGCMFSHYPFSDKDNTTPDFQLLGKWKELDPTPDTEARTFCISRVTDSKNGLQYITKDLKGELLCTRIGQEDYVSVRLTDSAGNEGYFFRVIVKCCG